jgi:hypothetical protein
MRNSMNVCLLCQINLANKRNSHILPRFLSTNFLAPNGGSGKGYELSSEKNSKNNFKIIQDSPKENYILCEECESYFGILERITCDNFINWKEKVVNGEFSLKNLIKHIDILDSQNNENKASVTLLVYSIFWRVSVSSLPIFKNLKISHDFETDLRMLLLNYKSIKKVMFLSKLGKNPIFRFFPYIIITAKSFIDETANILCAPSSSDHYNIIVDRFSFILFKTFNEIKSDLLREFCNISCNKFKMIVFSEKLWYDTVIKRAFEILTSKELESKTQL